MLKTEAGNKNLCLLLVLMIIRAVVYVRRKDLKKERTFFKILIILNKLKRELLERIKQNEDGEDLKDFSFSHPPDL